MKKKVISTQKLLFWTMLIMILPMLGACQKDDGMDQEGVINLKDIPENPIFADLPLVGTKWKLVGFANSETGKIKVADVGLRGEDRLPECARCFTLFFDEMGVFEFFSTLNKFMRNYRVENIDSQLFFEGGTEQLQENVAMVKNLQRLCIKWINSIFPPVVWHCTMAHLITFCFNPAWSKL